MKSDIFEHTTPRGIKGIVILRPKSNVFYSSISFHAGSRLVPDYVSKEQTAHIMEHVAANVLGFSSKGEFDESFRKNGAYRNASTGSEYMRYTAKCASFEWQRILGMQIHMLSAPNFNNEIVTVEKSNVRNELKGHLNDPRWVVDGQCEVALGNKDMGLEEQIKTIENVSLDDVVSFHDLAHVTSNMRFVIAGDIDLNEVDKILDGIRLASGDSLPTAEIKLRSADPVVIRRDGVPNVTYYLPIVLHKCLSIKEEYVLAILCDLLTGSLNSLLYGQVRSRGLAYDIRATYAIERFNSYFILRTAAPNDNLVKIARIIADTINKLRSDGVGQDVLEKLKARLSGRLMMGFETAQALSNYVEARYFADDTVVDINDLPSVVRLITADDISNLVEAFIGRGVWTLGLFGDTNQGYADRIRDITNEVFH